MKVATFCIFMALASIALADSPVRMELVTEAGFPLTGSQRWMKTLSKLDLDGVRIRTARPGDKPEILQVGSGFRVVGVLTSRGTLRLPGGNFTVNDTGKLTTWVRKLRAGTDPAAPEDRAAFALTSHELVAVHEGLSKPTTFRTKDMRCNQVIDRIASQLDFDVVVAAAARQTLRGGDTVADELEGVSSGTAMAATLRPLGLALVPRPTAAGNPKLFVTHVRNAPESWPVGWPSEKQTRDVAPKLFDFLPVEIQKQPITTVLSALQPRLEMPFLLDYNSIARQQIDLAKTSVSFPSGKTFYKRLLDKTLFQARLKLEVRVDEADQPFLWISPLKPNR